MGGARSTFWWRATRRFGVVALAALTLPPAVAALDARLGWRPVPGAAGYSVHRQVDALGWQTVDVVAAPVPDADGVVRHVVADLPVGRLVAFAVSAYDTAGGESAPSNALNVFVPPSPTATPPPATPTATSTVPPPTATPTPRPPVATATATDTPSATPTATRARRIRGRVAYYAGGEPVAGARVTLLGAGATLVTTADLDGTFTVDGSDGDTWQLQAESTGAAGTAVSALDAAWVLQTIAGTRALDEVQRLACDVTGNGSLTALDAAVLLQQAVGLVDDAPVTARCASPWLFLATPAAAAGQRVIPPRLDATTCTSGAIAYEPLTDPASGQDFAAVLFGDCTGNWRSGGAAFRQRGAGAALRLRAPVERWSGHWVVSLAARSTTPFSALDVRLGYDPRRVVIDEVRPGAATRHAAIAVRADASGRVAIALAAAEPMEVDDATVARVYLSADAPPVLRLLDARLDEEPVAVPP